MPILPRDEQIQDSCAAAYKIRLRSRVVPTTQAASQSIHIRGLGCKKEEGVKSKGVCDLPFGPLSYFWNLQTSQANPRHYCRAYKQLLRGETWRYVWRSHLGYMILFPLIMSVLRLSPPSDTVSFMPCPARCPACPGREDKGSQPSSPRDKASRYIAIAWSCRRRT